MRRVLVWDVPTRLFHWLLAAGFGIAAVVSLGLGDDSPLFPYHSIAGLTIAVMVVLRVVWGLVGSRYARFGSFAYGPGAVIGYMRGVVTGNGKRFIGHNPGSAVAIFAMLALTLGMGVTGVMLGLGNESPQELHEVMAWVFVGVVGAHVLGVLIHTIRHREAITLSMIHGTKQGEESDAIRSGHPLVAMVFLGVSAAWLGGLVRSYDPATQTTRLPLVGTVLQLEEIEEDEAESGEQEDDHD